MLTREKIIEAWIEKQSLRETIYQLTSGCDARMETTLNELCLGLENKIEKIDFFLNQNPALTASVISGYRETIGNYYKQKVMNEASFGSHR
jgi:hypothetical protein